MKTKLKLFVILFLTINLKLVAQSRPPDGYSMANNSPVQNRLIQKVIVYPGYTCYWNPTFLIPDSVIYVARPHAKVAARAAAFHPTGGRLNENRDYKKSGYDQGHLCNASDENGSEVDEYNSFDQCNIYPQRPNCNRLTWLALENYVRQMAVKYDSIKVKVYWHEIAGFMGRDKVVIPKYCDKTITYNSVTERYSMPNADTVTRHPFTFYKVP